MRRTSNEPPEIDFLGVGITVAIAVIIGFLMIEVMGSISAAELEAASKDIEHVCAGFFGCDGIQWYDWVPMLAIPVLAVGAGYLMSIVDSFEPPDETDDTDPVVAVQEKYVDGEIQTEAQLERELEWYLYPEENGENSDDL